MAHADGHNAMNFIDRRSMSSNLWVYMGVGVAWIFKKQVDTDLHSNGFEVRSLFSSVLKSSVLSKTYTDLG